ncbi:MAG TPA: M28 family peptidase [Chthonomonadaceae bacterium]|nr:M28 family peptidase [Chthonomonadaceae bacterium]
MLQLRSLRVAALAVGLCAAVAAADTPFPKPRLTPERRAVLESISANSLRGHLSFIASDALEGRGTPSRGLDIAAEYIAAQFRRAGLEPAGDDGYFQTATVSKRGSDTPERARNVIGILRGSDPVLKDTYVMVTAHYDHLGIRQVQGVPAIFNGADDDGSGTVSVIELASALGAAKTRCRRSIVFMTFYGEERGLLGSRYYGAHPAVPVAKTIADVNLEQIGRTDDIEGPRVSAASMTGYDFSDVGPIFHAAGEAVGVDVSKHKFNSDSFFARSDNQALADLGVPAHTICTAYEFPDYHQPGDHWDKIDYANMAKIDRMVALGLMTIADSPSEPHWNAQNPKASRYLTAWSALHTAGKR